ncbi:unnamed protein product [Lathyrus oleraceus]
MAQSLITWHQFNGGYAALMVFCLSTIGSSSTHLLIFEEDAPIYTRVNHFFNFSIFILLGLSIIVCILEMFMFFDVGFFPFKVFMFSSFDLHQVFYWEVCRLYPWVDDTYLGTPSMYSDLFESEKYDTIKEIGGPCGA